MKVVNNVGWMFTITLKKRITKSKCCQMTTPANKGTEKETQLTQSVEGAMGY